MQGQTKKLYKRTYFPIDVPSDRNKPLRQRNKREAFGPWMSGVESVRLVDGKSTTMVRLQDGGEELLSELAVTEIVERREVERPLR